MPESWSNSGCLFGTALVFLSLAQKLSQALALDSQNTTMLAEASRIVWTTLSWQEHGLDKLAQPSAQLNEHVATGGSSSARRLLLQE